MWFKITITLNGGRKFEGVRNLTAYNLHTAYFEVWEKAGKVFGEIRIDKIDLKELNEDDHEVIDYKKKWLNREITRD